MSQDIHPKRRRGRGATRDLPNRFEKRRQVFDPDVAQPDPEGEEEAQVNLQTLFLDDLSESIISYSDSPDLGRGSGLNPYRGCEHGCSYCYARPYHEYLGFSAGLEFEKRIMVKRRAAELLRRELSSPKYQPETLRMSGVTDCYQPVERRLRITRACLEVLAECRHPVGIITKNYMVTRDLDLLLRLAENNAVQVFLSITTLDPDLSAKMEPRASRPAHRLAAIELLAKAGIPVSVNVAPVIPGLNDHEIPTILSAARAAGASDAGYTVLRLPYGVKEVFTEWLSLNFPQKLDRVLSQLREVREGKLNSSEFGVRLSGKGPYADQIGQLFQVFPSRLAFPGIPDLDSTHFRKPEGDQMVFEMM